MDEQFSSPHMGFISPFPAGSQSRGAEISSELKETLRSFRDSLAFSFQTLNLTLSSLNNSVRMVATNLNPSASFFANHRYVQGNADPGNYLGYVSRQYANYTGNMSLMDLAFNRGQPYNVSPLEFWRNRSQDLSYRAGSMGLNLTGAAVKEGGTLAAMIYGGRAIAGALGMGGGVGSLLLGTPVGMAAGAVLGAVVDPMVSAGQQHNRDVAAIQRMSPRFGRGFTLAQSQQATRGIENLAYQEVMNTNYLDSRMGMSGMRDITLMGLQGNMFQGTSPDELIRQVSAASQVVKFLTGVMGNKDVKETMQMVKQLKDMGVNVFQSADVAKSMGTDAFKFGRIMGTDTGTLMNMAANMSTAAFGQYGNPAFVGIQPAMRNLAYLQELEKRQMLTPAEIAAGGGIQAMGSRMLGSQAGMLNSGAIGKPMLYAGWTGGKQFDINQYKAAFGNGSYFNVLGKATSNMISGGLGSIANALIETNNIMASAAEQGNMEELLDMQMSAALKNLNGVNDPNISLDTRVNIAAAHIMNIMAGQGTPVDAGTAKAQAQRILRPDIKRGLERRANNEYRVSQVEYANAQNSPMRFFESIGEGWDRFKASMYRNIIQKPAVAVTDAFTGAANIAYVGDMIGGEAPVTVDRIQNTLKAKDMLSRYNSREQSPMWSTKEIADAIEESRNRDDMTSSLRSLGNNIGSIFGGTHKLLDNMIVANDNMANTKLWKRMLSKDRLSEMDAFSAVGYMLNKDTTMEDLGNIVRSVADKNRDSSYSNIIGAGEALLRKSRSGYKDNLDTLASTWLESTESGTVSYNADNLRQAFLSDNSLKRLLDSNNKFSGMDTDQAYQMLDNNKQVDQLLEPEIKKIMKAKGISYDSARRAAIGRLSVEFAEKKNEGSFARWYAAGQSDAVLKLAEGSGSLYGADKKSGQDMYGMNLLGFNNAASELTNVGITLDQISTLSTGETGFNDLQAIAENVGKFMGTGESELTSGTMSKMQGVSSRVGRSIQESLFKQGSNKLQRSMDSYAKKNLSTSDYELYRMGDTKLRERIGRDFILENGSTVMANQGMRDLQNFFSDMGIKMTDEELHKLTNAGALTDTLARFNNSDNALARNIGSEAARLQRLNDAQLQREGKRVLSQEQLDSILTGGSVTSTNRGKLQDALLTAQATAMQVQGKKEEVSAAVTKNSAIDTAVATDSANPYVRVKMVENTPGESARKIVQDSVEKLAGKNIAGKDLTVDLFPKWGFRGPSD